MDPPGLGIGKITGSFGGALRVTDRREGQKGIHVVGDGILPGLVDP